MKILVACEESQIVTKEFRRLGHEAYSCDIMDCSGGHPEWHHKEDVTLLLEEKWDMIISFPPCTYLTNASAVRMRVKGKIQIERYEKMLEAKKFFLLFHNHDCEKIVIENPVPLGLCGLPPYNQIIQPWQFGHHYSKRTCLWIKGLPLLVPTQIMKEYSQFVNCERDSKRRSKTFTGIAKGMAEQWGNYV